MKRYTLSFVNADRSIQFRATVEGTDSRDAIRAAGEVITVPHGVLCLMTERVESMAE